MQKKNGWISLIGILVLLMLGILMYCLQCKHPNVATESVKAPTCINSGLSQIVCVNCNAILSEQVISEFGHEYGEYVNISDPTPTRNGIEERTCIHCGNKESREYACIHPNLETKIIQEATCNYEGVMQEFCVTCELVLSETSIEKLECVWGDWKETKAATPISNGKKERVCSLCQQKESTIFSMSMPHKDSVYVPGTGICHRIGTVGLTQSTVDAYDLVYDTSYYGTSGPWILGHKYGTMSKLPNVKVGQNIYLSVDGVIKTYVVRYSEFARQNDSWTDIVGQTSGVSVLTDLSKETLHMYTCYGSNKNDRWMVLAELVN